MILVIKNKNELFFLGVVFLVFIMSFFIPEINDLSYNYFCFTIYILMSATFFLIKKKKNFFDFDSIFVLIYGIVAFLFPIFLSSLPDKVLTVLFNSLSFNYNLIPKGAYISLLGMSGYFSGSLFLATKNNNLWKKNTIEIKFLLFFALICVFLFILTGGIQYYQSVYQSNSAKQASGSVMQVIALLQSFMLVSIATEAYNTFVDKSYKLSKFFIFTCIIVSVLFLYSGSRTNASFFMLPIIFWYSKLYKPVGLLKFIGLMVLAIVLMWVIQVTRTGSNVQLTQSVVVFKDLVLVNRNTYVGIEYVDKFGFTYGKTMLSGLIGVVPSLERLLTSLFGMNIRNFGSAELFTDYTFGHSLNSFGLGTNIFIDLYLSFGYLGTFLFLMFLGYLVKNSLYQVDQGSYYYFIIYTVLIANSVYLVRTGFTFPAKMLIWTFIIANLNIGFNKRINLRLYT